MEPDWNDLRYLLAVARTGSLAGAARSAGVRHSTVGRRLDALEIALGGKLVDRGASGASLTAMGERLVPLAARAEEAVRALVTAATGGQRRLKVATPTGFAAILARPVAEFLRKNPTIGIDIVSSSGRADLDRGEADIAIRMGPVDGPDLIARQVGAVGWSLYASEAYLADRPDIDLANGLAGHLLVGFGAGMAGSAAQGWLDAHASHATVALRQSQMSEVVAAAAEGAGAALLPCVLADAEPRLQRLTAEVLVRQPVTLVFRRDTGEDPAGRRAIQMLATALRNARAALGGDRR